MVNKKKLLGIFSVSFGLVVALCWIAIAALTVQNTIAVPVMIESLEERATRMCRGAVVSHLARSVAPEVPNGQLRFLPGFGLEVRGQLAATNSLGESVETSYVCRIRKDAESLVLQEVEITEHSL